MRKSWTISSYDEKTLLQQFHFVEQCNLAVHMLRPLRHKNRFNHQILSFHIMIFFIFVRKITWSNGRGGIKLLDWQCRKKLHMIRREINWYLTDWQLLWLMLAFWKWTCIWPTRTPSKETQISTISIDECINTLQAIFEHTSHLISLESRELCCWLVEEHEWCFYICVSSS